MDNGWLDIVQFRVIIRSIRAPCLEGVLVQYMSDTLLGLAREGKFSEVLVRCPVAEGLVRAHGVVDLLPGAELAVKGPD